jgi:hypothetical protein
MMIGFCFESCVETIEAGFGEKSLDRNGKKETFLHPNVVFISS